MAAYKDTTLNQFSDWLLHLLKEKGKLNMEDVICSGAEKMNWTIETTKEYLGKVLLKRSGQVKLNLDEGKGMKFLEYRKDYHYVGEKRDHEDYQGAESEHDEADDKDSEENVYKL